MHRSLLALAVAACFATPSLAIKQFQDQFLEKYADGSDEAYTDLAKGAKCYVCHQGKKKKNRNPFGRAHAEHLTKKDKKDVDKIVAALEEVAEQSSNADDPDAPTFGELIAEGKLPGGSVEDAKQEPDDA